MTADDTGRLLGLARAALKAEVLPHLPPERRYPALMVLTALGIAERRAARGGAAHDAARAALAPFAGGDPDTALATLARRLRAEPDLASASLHAALLDMARRACSESNPKARALTGLPRESE